MLGEELRNIVYSKFERDLKIFITKLHKEWPSLVKTFREHAKHGKTSIKLGKKNNPFYRFLFVEKNAKDCRTYFNYFLEKQGLKCFFEIKRDDMTFFPINILKISWC